MDIWLAVERCQLSLATSSQPLSHRLFSPDSLNGAETATPVPSHQASPQPVTSTRNSAVSSHVLFPLRGTSAFQTPGSHGYCGLCTIRFSTPSTFIAHEKYYWFSRTMGHVKRARRHRVEWCAIYTAHLSLQLQGWLDHRHTEKGQTLDCWDSCFWNVIKHRPRWKGPPGSLACNKDVPFDEPALMNRNF